MKEYILAEARLHPQAQPQDYIKLIFQSEFGPGHLIADRSFSHSRLKEEWATVSHLPFEDMQEIGGGYVRLNIKGIDENRLEKINTAFVTSANEKSGTQAGFMEKLRLFTDMAAAGRFVFDARRAQQAVADYLSGGIAPISHTRQYHGRYAPAYRVVKKEYLK